MFEAQVTQFNTDLNNNSTLKGQCPGGNASNVPWICIDSTYY